MGNAGKHFKPTMKYLKSKGLQLFLLTIVPSLLTSFIISPSSMLYSLCTFFDIESFDFATLFLRAATFNSTLFYVGIIGLVLYVFVIAIMLGTVDRHMRTGGFTISISRAKSRIDYNLLTALKMIVVIIIMFELYNIINISFTLLWAGTFATKNSVFVFSLITFAVTSFAFLVVASSLILWPAFMLHTGLSSFEAFKMAIRHNRGNTLRVGGVLLIPVLPLVVLMVLNAILGWGGIVRLVLDGVCLAILSVIFVVLMYIVFYDVTGTERMDLQKVDIWSKKKGV